MEGLGFDYDALREALLRDTGRNQLIHRWISDQYQFALDESGMDDLLSHPAPGAMKEDNASGIQADTNSCPCYDELFLQPSPTICDSYEETERETALRFLLHEMRDWYLDDDERRSKYAKSIRVCPPSPTPSSSYSDTPPTSPTSIGPRTPSFASTATFPPPPFLHIPDNCVPSPPRSSSLPRRRSERLICVDTANMPYLQTPSSSTLRPSASRWSLSTCAVDTHAQAPANDSTESLKSVKTKSLKSSRSVKRLTVDLKKLKVLNPQTYRRKKLLIQGVPSDDDEGFESVKKWCEEFGSLSRVSRKPNGDIHIHFSKTSVADTVCRLNHTKVHIKGAGSVTLSYFTGKRPS